MIGNLGQLLSTITQASGSLGIGGDSGGSLFDVWRKAHQARQAPGSLFGAAPQFDQAGAAGQAGEAGPLSWQQRVQGLLQNPVFAQMLAGQMQQPQPLQGGGVHGPPQGLLGPGYQLPSVASPVGLLGRGV
jgi:hypothetical protein